jgi:hypothetical protein
MSSGGHVPDSPVIPERFQRKIDEHLVFNFVGSGSWPLVLGIFGRPGDGKSFQARKHLENRGVLAVSINAADLESDRAGQPGKLVLARYEDAGHRASEGVPAALIVDDFDTTVCPRSRQTPRMCSWEFPRSGLRVWSPRFVAEP